MDGNGFPVLKKIDGPENLKGLSEGEPVQLSEEIRQFMIEKVSKTGGHLGSFLGMVELTVVLHYLFESPKDKIIWDIGHQKLYLSLLRTTQALLILPQTDLTILPI